MTVEVKSVPSISVSYARNGTSTKANALGMRPMQERAYEKRGEQYLLIKSPPASGKSRALMFIALDKLKNQGLKQAIIVVPEKAIGASFQDEPLSKFGFWKDWHVEPKWNLCNAPGDDNGGKVKSVGHRRGYGTGGKAGIALFGGHGGCLYVRFDRNRASSDRGFN
jgi:hypothetical protein